MLLMVCGWAQAQVTYTYQGNNFTTFAPPYSSSSQITGSIQLASALPANSTTDLVGSIQAFSFTDGQATRDPSNTTLCQFSVTTNGQGLISAWSIFMRQNNTAATENQHAIDLFSGASTPDQSGFDANTGNTGCGNIGLNPSGFSDAAPPSNAWSGGPTVSAQPVPTLSINLLLLLGLICLFIGLKRLSKQA